MGGCDDEASLDMLTNMAIRLDNLIRDQHPARIAYTPRPSPMPPVKRMQLGSTRMNPGECEWRRCEGRCYYYGVKEHLLAQCPHRRSQQLECTLEASMVRPHFSHSCSQCRSTTQTSILCLQCYRFRFSRQLPGPRHCSKVEDSPKNPG